MKGNVKRHLGIVIGIDKVIHTVILRGKKNAMTALKVL